jgi:hypothetical protein
MARISEARSAACGPFARRSPASWGWCRCCRPAACGAFSASKLPRRLAPTASASACSQRGRRLPVRVAHKGGRGRGMGVERHIGAPRLHHRQVVLWPPRWGRSRSPDRPWPCPPWWCRWHRRGWRSGYGSRWRRPLRQAGGVLGDHALAFQVRGHAQQRPMVITPVPPTPATTMPQACSATGSTGSGMLGRASRLPFSFLGFLSCRPRR